MATLTITGIIKITTIFTTVDSDFLIAENQN